MGYDVKLSSDGNTIVVAGWNSEITRIYKNIEGVWTQIGDDLIGRDVSLSNDGNIIAVSSIFNNGGSAQVYQNINNQWVQVGDVIQETFPSTFGRVVSLSGDGNIIAIGAGSSFVFVYQFVNDDWVQLGDYIYSGCSSDHSSSHINLSEDGTVVVMGGWFCSDVPYLAGRTTVYQFINNEWNQVGIEIFGEHVYDYSGISVGLSADGSILAIGAFGNDDNGSDAGHVRVFGLTDVLSVEDQDESEFKIYPNPAKHQFTVQLNDASSLEKVTIYNTLGQEILTSKKSIVNTSKLTSGAYVVQITTNTGKAFKTLIIQ